MLILILFAFIAGIVTILSPCILPILPIVLSGALSGGRWRPLGVVLGFVGSFTFFAVFSFTLAKLLGFSPDVLRYISVGLLIMFGASLFIPRIQLIFETFTARFSSFGQQKREGLLGGIVLGVSLGFIWTPCVGPILASVLTLAATSQISSELILITLAFSIGTALPMLGIAYGGQKALATLPWLKAHAQNIQKVFGVLIIVVAVMILFNIDRQIQVYILKKFPQYGAGLTSLENRPTIQAEIKKLEEKPPLGTSDVPNPDFAGGTKWVNSEPQSLNTTLKGKVVLVDFWTYTCINCIRTLPYITRWYNTYKDDGFVVIGVHSPEFAFEKETKNVEKAIKDFGIQYPVVQDNDFAIWQSYDNHYWPAHYLIDRNGRIRDTHFGEGNYAETEAKIRELLAEGGSVSSAPTNMAEDVPAGPLTPETYVGYQRMERFGSLEQIAPDLSKSYSAPKTLPNDTFAFSGMWTVGPESATSTKDAKLTLHFQAKNVFLVMKPHSKLPGKVRVLLDGKETKIIVITEDKLYQLVALQQSGEHTLTLQFIDNSVEVFAFTFG